LDLKLPFEITKRFLRNDKFWVFYLWLLIFLLLIFGTRIEEIFKISIIYPICVACAILDLKLPFEITKRFLRNDKFWVFYLWLLIFLLLIFGTQIEEIFKISIIYPICVACAILDLKLPFEITKRFLRNDKFWVFYLWLLIFLILIFGTRIEEIFIISIIYPICVTCAILDLKLKLILNLISSFQ
jgi:TRAP-type C4-dicarboxylate transport system permease large subunit